eukprot:1992973-Alexandrium_andersonii.AAC.1
MPLHCLPPLSALQQAPASYHCLTAVAVPLPVLVADPCQHVPRQSEAHYSPHCTPLCRAAIPAIHQQPRVPHSKPLKHRYDTQDTARYPRQRAGAKWGLILPPTAGPGAA